LQIDFVSIGNANNQNHSSGLGGVSYDYAMGKYEVTVNQYVTFLNSVASASDNYGLYNLGGMSSGQFATISRTENSGVYSYASIGGFGYRPINYVSWFNAARFANWLHNGANATASTETGAYTLNGSNSGAGVARNPDAKFWIPNLNEWVKAAYFDPTLSDGEGGYWNYMTRSNSHPGNQIGSTPNQANFNAYNLNGGGYAQTGSPTWDGGVNYTTDVGAFSGSSSYYGTFDQGGNVYEWFEDALAGSGSTAYKMLGGAYDGGGPGYGSNGIPAIGDTLSSNSVATTTQENWSGFRIATVPEPSSLSLLLTGGAVLLGMFKTRKTRI
jgi:formylglycine-generating enzyme required for sulfatase activity